MEKAAMSYKLYYAPSSAAMGIRVILEEIGASYELLPSTTDMSEPRPPEQLAANPNGWVPVLLWDDHFMYEAAAITIFLCDRYPQAKLAPSTNEPERGIFLQTLVYFSSSVQNAFQLDYYPERFADAPADEPSAQRRGCRRLRETWGVIDDQIGDKDWILGERFSAADIYLFMLTTWLRPSRGQPSLAEFSNVHRIAKAVEKRPSVQRVYGDWIAKRNEATRKPAHPERLA